MITVDVPVVQITRGALADLTGHARLSLDGLETGGILLGRDTPDWLRVQHAGDPGPHAERGSRRFLRDLNHAQALAADAWHLDGSLWIGEWHTHPSTGPTPSDVDLDSYLRHLHDPELGFDRFVAIVVSLQPPGTMNAVAWVIERQSARPALLRTASD